MCRGGRTDPKATTKLAGRAVACREVHLRRAEEVMVERCDSKFPAECSRRHRTHTTRWQLLGGDRRFLEACGESGTNVIFCCVPRKPIRVGGQPFVACEWSTLVTAAAGVVHFAARSVRATLTDMQAAIKFTYPTNR